MSSQLNMIREYRFPRPNKPDVFMQWKRVSPSFSAIRFLDPDSKTHIPAPSGANVVEYKFPQRTNDAKILHHTENVYGLTNTLAYEVVVDRTVVLRIQTEKRTVAHIVGNAEPVTECEWPASDDPWYDDKSPREVDRICVAEAFMTMEEVEEKYRTLQEEWQQAEEERERRKRARCACACHD